MTRVQPLTEFNDVSSPVAPTPAYTKNHKP